MVGLLDLRACGQSSAGRRGVIYGLVASFNAEKSSSLRGRLPSFLSGSAVEKFVFYGVFRSDQIRFSFF